MTQTTAAGDSEDWLDARVKRLTQLDRDQYEASCRQVEDALAADPDGLEAIAAIVKTAARVEHLVLAHAGRCWLEWQGGGAALLERFLARFSELRSANWAVTELSRWARVVRSQEARAAGEKPVTDHPAEFVLPGHLQLIERCKASGMGQAMVVKNLQTNRVEVLKAASPEILQNAEALRRFKTEPFKASHFNHPGIVTVFGCEESGAIPFFLMEYMNGGTLAERLTAGPIPQRQAAEYLASAARVMAVIHEKGGFAHGDIKPENILFTRTDDGRECLKLADFGLTRPLPPDWKRSLSNHAPTVDRAALAATAALSGTPGYISPEMLDPSLCEPVTGEAPVVDGTSSDLFALGTTLYRCLTGKLPYQNSSDRVDPLGPLFNELVLPSVVNPGVDPVLDAICQRALRRSPRHRFRDAREFAAALEQFLAQTPAEPGRRETPATTDAAKANTQPRRPKAKQRDSKRMLIAAGVIVLGAIIGWRMMGVDKSAQGKGDNNAMPVAPVPGKVALTGDRRLDSLITAGWSREPAQQVVELNRQWWEACDLDKKGSADQQIAALANLPAAVPTSELKGLPHLASLLAITPAEHREDAYKQTVMADRLELGLIENLFVRYASGEFRGKLASRLASGDRAVFLEIQRQNLTGAEALLLGDSKAEPYYKVARSVFGNGQRGLDPATLLRRFAVLVFHGPELRRRMSRDENFAAAFPALWNDFVTLTDPSRSDAGAIKHHTVEQLMADPAIWDVLAEPKGKELVEALGLVPVAVLYGNPRYLPELRERLKELLLTRNTVVVKALLDSPYRGDPQFQTLLRRPLDNKLLAYAMANLQEAGDNYSETLGEYAQMPDQQLEHELDPATHKRTGLARLPLGDYINVGVKWLSNEPIYSDEIRRMKYALAQDAVAVAGAAFGVPPNVTNAVTTTIGTATAMAEERRLANEAARADKVNSAEITRLQTKAMEAQAADALGRSQEFIECLSELQKRLVTKTDRRAMDVTLNLEFYALPAGGGASFDPRQIRYIRLPGGQMVVRIVKDSAFEKQHPKAAAYINTRVDWLIQRAAESGRAGVIDQSDEFEKKYQQSVSAWWLLCASADAPELDQTAGSKPGEAK